MLSCYFFCPHEKKKKTCYECSNSRCKMGNFAIQRANILQTSQIRVGKRWYISLMVDNYILNNWLQKEM